MGHDIRGLWDANQTNGFVVTVNVDPVQPDGSFTIQAEHSKGSVTGSGAGHVKGDRVDFTITWNNGTQGAYNGTFNAQGFIQGATFDVMHPESFAGWSSSKAFH